MKMFKPSAMILFLLAASLIATAQTPASKISLVGNWAGFAENQGNYDEVTLTIEKKGETYTGKLKDVMGMFPDVEIKNVILKDNKVTFEFPGTMGGMEFSIKAEMTLTEKTMNGMWTMVEDGSTGALEFTRK